MTMECERKVIPDIFVVDIKEGSENKLFDSKMGLNEMETMNRMNSFWMLMHRHYNNVNNLLFYNNA